jgi:hypothetical protein
VGKLNRLTLEGYQILKEKRRDCDGILTGRGNKKGSLF